MTGFQWKAAGLVLACLLLVGLGAAGGVWLGARHYRPQLDAASADLAACPFELENGRIKRNREFMNPIQKLRALGIAVPQIKRDGIPT